MSIVNKLVSGISALRLVCDRCGAILMINNRSNHRIELLDIELCDECLEVVKEEIESYE